MTDTIARPAAADAAADFLPLKGIDHIEFWVGNAKQAAAYYRVLWGFTPVAYAGLETGVRDRASYVLVQNEIRFVFTAPLTPDGELAEHVRQHGDGGTRRLAARPCRAQIGLHQPDPAVGFVHRRCAKRAEPLDDIGVGSPDVADNDRLHASSSNATGNSR